jgi:hypothetical protein
MARLEKKKQRKRGAAVAAIALKKKEVEEMTEVTTRELAVAGLARITG